MRGRGREICRRGRALLNVLIQFVFTKDAIFVNEGLMLAVIETGGTDIRKTINI
jgi:hypothetical protein